MPILRLLPLPRTIPLRPHLRPSPAALLLLLLPLHKTTRAPYSAASSTFQPGPSPPRLPADQQAEFERLQRTVAERIADPTPLPHERPPPSPSPASTSPRTSPRHAPSITITTPATATAKATQEKEDTLLLPTSVRRGAKPEFEGDTNPKTGEVGGPKNEPLRWGSGGDWSYNGRVTDF